MVVSPDVGGVVRARGLAKRIDAPLAIVDKRRERAGESEVMNVIGDVAGKTLHPGRRHRRFRRHAVQCGRSAARTRARRTSTPTSPTACCRAAPSARIAGFEAEGACRSPIRSSRPRPSQVAQNIRVLSIASLIGEAIGRTAQEEVGVEPVRLGSGLDRFGQRSRSPAGLQFKYRTTNTVSRSRGCLDQLICPSGAKRVRARRQVRDLRRTREASSATAFRSIFGLVFVVIDHAELHNRHDPIHESRFLRMQS